MTVLTSTPVYEAFLVHRPLLPTLIGPWIETLTKLVFCLLVVDVYAGFHHVKRHLRDDSMHQRSGFSYRPYVPLLNLTDNFILHLMSLVLVRKVTQIS